MSADFQGTPSSLTGRQFATTVNVLAGRRIVAPASIEDEIGANQDDWEPSGLADANFISVAQDGGPFSITGLAGGGAKTIKNICNDDETENLTLKHQDVSSEEANRFNLGGSDIVLAPGEAIALEYDTVAERWNKVTVVVPFPLANDPGEPGLPGLNWLGAWIASPSTAYAENDGVSNNGRSYICLVAHSSDSTNEPGAGVYTANYWSLLADKGADGTGTGDMQASVYDPNSVEADAFDQDNMVDGTTNKNYSATEKTKLAGIASSADVTSATNVGSSIHGVTAKTTPVDADEVGLIDSAASNVLKKLTWANIKATLKTYLDTLYATAAQGALADSAAQPADIREKLTANRTYYVRTDGSDTNNGLTDSSGGAFATVNKALSTIRSTLDVAGFTITIQLGDGTYTGAVGDNLSWVGGGSIIITGQNTTGTILTASSGNTFATGGILGGKVTIQKLKLTNTGSGVCCYHGGIGTLQIGTNIEFGAATGGYHIRCGAPGAFIIATNGYTISGGAFTHQHSSNGGFIQIEGGTITLTGTPAFNGQYLWMTGAAITRITATFSGSATGIRYTVTENSVATGGGVGANYLPGNSAGSTATGGQYSL